MQAMEIDRPTLGPLMSVVCFGYLATDAEELAGPGLLVDAGRQRGQDVIEALGKTGSHQQAAAIQRELDAALGEQGTRLCLIQQISEQADGSFEVHAAECASDTYTLGVLIGAISAITGTRMLGKQTGPSEMGTNGRVYTIYPL